MFCNESVYNQFDALDTATKDIVDYLFSNAPDFWKLLYYIEPNVLPLSKSDLPQKQKKKMIATDPYDVNENVDKNILFQTTSDEAFSAAVPQVRFETGVIAPIDAYRGFINIDIQIIVPNKQELFTAPYNSVASRSDALFRELVKALNGKDIPNSKFKSKLFMDRSAPDGAGRNNGSYRQQMNKSFTGRWVTFSVLV